MANKRIVLIVPEAMLDLAEDAARALQMSRQAFIRQAITSKLVKYAKEDAKELDALLRMYGSDI